MVGASARGGSRPRGGTRRTRSARRSSPPRSCRTRAPAPRSRRLAGRSRAPGDRRRRARGIPDGPDGRLRRAFRRGTRRLAFRRIASISPSRPRRVRATAAIGEPLDALPIAVPKRLDEPSSSKRAKACCRATPARKRRRASRGTRRLRRTPSRSEPRSSRTRRASAGLAPPVPTATASGLRLTIAGMRKVQCSGSSAAFNQTPRFAASSAIAEWIATDPVAANAIAAPARSPLRYARRATVRAGLAPAHAVISSDTSGAITVTVAPVCSSVSTFRAATSPPHDDADPRFEVHRDRQVSHRVDAGAQAARALPRRSRRATRRVRGATRPSSCGVTEAPEALTDAERGALAPQPVQALSSRTLVS